MPWPLAVLGCVLLCTAQATQFAAFGFAYTFACKRTRCGAIFTGTIVFLAAEFVCPQLFPHYFGASQHKIIPLIQIADLTGVMGITAVLVMVNAGIFELVRGIVRQEKFYWQQLLVISIVLAMTLVYGYVRMSAVDEAMAAAPKLRIGIAQANLGIREKERFPERAIDINQKLSRRLEAYGAELIVWPETAVQGPVLEGNEKKLPAEVFLDLKTPLLTGAIEVSQDGFIQKTHNVAVLSNETGDIIGKYQKQKLLMFGEYIPFGEAFPILYRWAPFISKFVPGNSDEPLVIDGRRLNVNICYEGILPRFMARMMRNGANVMINLTNDNWFGMTNEPIQHLVLSLFRAVEHRRWLVRSTNTGISAFVDAAGRMVAKTPLAKPAIMIADVPMLHTESLYTRYGDWLGWSALVLTAMLFFRSLSKRGRSKLASR
jgi:apolipoprotein N-acyltransferase